MPFSEQIRNLAKWKSAHRCCICHKPFVEVHHLKPQADGGDDTLDNAAPLCASCHDLYGGNPEKRKTIRQMRDDWWNLMAKRRNHITELPEIDESVEIAEDRLSDGGMHSKSIAIYHAVFPEEDFTSSAQHILALIQAAQKSHPNHPRYFFLDIEGHRTESGAFDNDTFELQRHFLLGFASRYLTGLNMPLIHIRNNKAQINTIPDLLEITADINQDSINDAIDKGCKEIWISDRDQLLRFD
ncbi:MAG: HNH endonuclease signature motif containing protein [Verrucomicrobiota bacterium]